MDAALPLGAMEINKDHYATLGLVPSVDGEVIKAAARALLKKYHPDTQGAETTARAADIIEAYRVLGDAELRRAYDASRRETHIEYKPSPAAADFRTMRPRRQPGLFHTMATALVMAWGLRALISGCVIAFLIFGGMGSRIIEALKPLSALSAMVSGASNPFAFKAHDVFVERKFAQSPGVLDSLVTDFASPKTVQMEDSPTGERLVVRTEMRGTSKVLRLVREKDTSVLNRLFHGGH